MSERRIGRPGPGDVMGAPLTGTQVAALSLLISGMTSAQAAEAMGKRRSAIQQHITRACRRLGAKNALQACVLFDRQQRPKGD